MSQILPCPFCQEQISATARVCRSCRRELAQDLWVHHAPDSKQILELLKNWKSAAPNGRSQKWANVTEAKKFFEESPQRIAWDLNPAEAQTLIQKFEGLPIELKSRIDSSNLSEELSVARKNPWPSRVFGAVAVISFATLGYFWFQKKPVEAPVYEVRKELPETSIDIHFKTGTTMPTPIEQGYPAPPAQTREREAPSRKNMEKLLNATVYIRGPNTVGSGFLISSDGYILSNSHVTSKMDTPVVMFRDGRSFKAKKIREDGRVDLALIKIDVRNAPYLEMGDANDLYAGQPILTIGNPSGLSFTVTGGLVSFLGREIKGVQYIQTDAAINPGNSGGPMITDDLKVVGINTLTSVGQAGISFSLPINYAYQAGGIARNIGVAPQTAGDFTPNPTDTMVASLQGSSSGPSTSEHMYQNEAADLKTQLDRKDKDIRAEFDVVQNQIKDLQAKRKNVEHDSFKAGEVDREIDRLSRKLDNLSSAHKQMQLNYLDQVISILQRQKADSRFEAFSSQIDGQIQELETQKRALESKSP